MAGSKGKGPYKVLCGSCPDPQCKTKLFFPAHDSSIECTACGQRHERRAITEVAEVTNPQVALHNILKNILIGNTKPKKGTDSVKVLGLSNYQCKLVSPLLTKYGMDKQTGKAVLLKDMGQSAHFDCGILGDRAFLIEQEHIDTIGYGRDRTGSVRYLKATLDAIKQANNGEETLIPIHADGDGHCLVHAVSRALVGRELFWHALRENLKSHLTNNLEKYKLLFQDFVDTDEWEIIIQECDPDFAPGDGEPLGLRNMHIFGLANLLRRPIVLLDSVSGLQSSGDYSGVFLPGLVDPGLCCGKDGRPNKPLCLAWSSSGRNHYITLVGVKGRPLPKLPSWMLPKVWGMPQELVNQYVEFDVDGCCVIGGSKCLQEKYILRLVHAMEDVFQSEYGVSPALVTDVHHFLYKSSGMVGVKMDAVIEEARQATSENRLYRCNTCEAVVEFSVAPEWLRPGGALYNLAHKTHTTLSPDKNYTFTQQGLVCRYDKDRDILVPDMAKSRLTSCSWCQGTTMRLLKSDGSTAYQNGDKTSTKSDKSRCTCGYKHYWDGNEYDNLPEVFPISLDWNGQVIAEKVIWFQYESDPALNSNVFEVAQSLVQKHFPGEFGSERLVQKVVETILRFTANKDGAGETSKGAGGAGGGGAEGGGDQGGGEGSKKAEWKDDTASKIILTGFKSKTMHKEELSMSNAEKALKKNIEQKAQQQQKRKTTEHAAQGKISSKGGPAKSTTKVQKKDSPKLTVSTSRPVGAPSPPMGAPSPPMGAPSPPMGAPSPPMGAPSSPMGVPSPPMGAPSPPMGAPSPPMGAPSPPMGEPSPPMGAPSPPMGAPSPPMGAPSPPMGAPSSPSRAIKKIKVTTSDGRQLMLSLEKETTYSVLQEILQRELNIAPERQRIKCGFPPRELKPPVEGREGEGLPLQHGDRVTVEILPDPTEMIAMETNQAALNSALGSSDIAQELLKGISSLQDGASGDSLNTSIDALAGVATMMGRDLWTYVQAMPSLFRPGGLFYEQVKRDLGLEADKHARLPAIPDKVFRYNKSTDALELCMEPVGHFAIGPDIDDRIKQAQTSFLGAQSGGVHLDGAIPSPVLSSSSASNATSFHTLSELSDNVKKALGTGATGVAVNQPMKWPGSGHVAAFSGKGHTLSGGSVLAPSHTFTGPGSPRHRPMDIDSDEDAALFNPDHKTDSVDIGSKGANAEKASTSKGGGAKTAAQESSALFERVGPGYTRLNPTKHNESNVQSEVFHTIASSIQAALAEDPVPQVLTMDNAKEDDVQVTSGDDVSERHAQMTSPPEANDTSNNNALATVAPPGDETSTGNSDVDMDQSNNANAGSSDR